MSPSLKQDHPFWLNKSLFKDIVANDYNSSRIAGFGVKVASGNGENYASILYRINAKVENDRNGLDHRSYMVKVNHESGFGVEMAKALQLFPKEIAMYKNLLPTFEKYFEAIGDNLKIGPKCVLAESQPREMIIMEDISIDGFKTADRALGLDMKHVNLVLEKLAKYHAASAYHFEQNGDYDALFKYGLINENFVSGRDMSGHYSMLKNFLKDLKCAPILNKLFDNYKALMNDKSLEVVKVRADRFNVLCHGDLWSNNCMFRYADSGAVEECMFVDFQMCYYGSPMLDLHYFIINSLSKENKASQADQILHTYHKHLAKSLRALSYKGKIPTLLDLQMDFLDTGAFGVFSLISVFPVVSAPPSDDSTLDNVTNDSGSDASLAIKRRMYTNTLFTETLEELIPIFERKGYFEL